jgi:Mn-dependent DtxR family transcriptional regulator
MIAITPKDMATLRAIRDAQKRDRYSASLRELAALLGIGCTTMKARVDRLAVRGLVTYQPRNSRTLRITPRGMELLE